MTVRPLLCFVSDGSLPPDAGPSDLARTVEAIRRAIDAGIDLVQVRERNLPDRRLLDLVQRAVAAARGGGARVLVNERVDIALAAGASGVHLRGDSIAASDARALVPPSWLVGRSIHSAEEAAAPGVTAGCDYLVFGTVFQTASKPAGHPVSGVAELRRVCGATSLPVLAIGGVTLERVPAVAAAGAAGIAAITLFGRTAPVADRVAAVRRLFDT